MLTEMLREGARKMLAAAAALALALEVEKYIQRFAKEGDERGHRLVVRNGSFPERTILTGVGAVNVAQPRVRSTELKRQILTAPVWGKRSGAKTPASIRRARNESKSAVSRLWIEASQKQVDEFRSRTSSERTGWS